MFVDATPFDRWRDRNLDAIAEARIEALRRNLADGVVERDAQGSAPWKEASLLRESGLLPLAISEERVADDIIARWLAVTAVIRRLARVDVSAAALIGYSYMHLLRIRVAGDGDVYRRAAAESLAQPLLWGGANNPRGERASLRRVEGGYILSGRKAFATGAQVADRLVIGEALPTPDNPDARVAFVLDARAEGVSHGDDWTVIGARRSASGSIVFRNVFVPESAIFSRAVADPARRSVSESLGSLAFQIMFVNLLVGAAQGSIEVATHYLRNRDGGPRSSENDDVLQILGAATAAASAAAALGDQADDVFARAVAAALTDSLGPRERGVAGDLISRAKVVAHRAALDVASDSFEAVGARGATTTLGLDRYWRDIRTFTLHDSIAVKQREIGAFILEGRTPEPSTNS